MAVLGDGGGCSTELGGGVPVPSGGVLVLLGAASTKVHPAHVVSVFYPVAGGHAAGSAAQGGSGLVGGRCGTQHTHTDDDVMRRERRSSVVTGLLPTFLPGPTGLRNVNVEL